MTIRESLTGHRRHFKQLDMEKIYRQIDMGMSLDDVAKEWGVCVRTLYRRHAAYQYEAQLESEELEEQEKKEGELPPLPDEI